MSDHNYDGLECTYRARDVRERVCMMQLAELAVELAKQAGEKVTRPLTKVQLERAVRVNAVEANILKAML